MKLTLYRNCILNDSYNTVLSLNNFGNTGKSVLENYLDTLYSKVIECDNSYYKNNDSLILDEEIYTSFASYIYEFNYMKIEFETENNLKILKYCFIISIKSRNGCVYINYNEDVWHTYSDKIHYSSACNFANSRAKQYSSNTEFAYRKLPYKYDGNQALNILETRDTHARILVEIQVEQLKPATVNGNTTWVGMDNRWVNYCLYENESGVSTFSRSTIYEEIAYLVRQSPIGHLSYTGQSTVVVQLNYWVGDIYIIPESFDISEFIENNFTYQLLDGTVTYTNHFKLYKLNGNYYNKYYEIFNGNLVNDYKTISIGSHSKQYQIIPNGNPINFTVDFAYDLSNISLRLSIQNQTFNITEDFKYDYPAVPISADGYAQRKIALELKNTQLNARAFVGGVNLGTGMTGIASSWGKNLLNYSEEGRFSIGEMQQSSLATGKSLGNIADIVETIKSKKLLNSPMYSNYQANWGNSKFFLNYFVPIVVCKINPNNSNFVKKCVDYYGYETYQMIGGTTISWLFSQEVYTYLSETLNMTYNAMRFENISVSGYFPEDIGRKLDRILENGIVIFYNPYFLDDNYTDELLS